MKQHVRLVGAILVCAVWAGCASAPNIALTQSLELPGTGYTMDYPAGWYKEVMEPLGWAVVSQNKVALVDGMVTSGGSASQSSTLPGGTGLSAGYQVWFQKISGLTAGQVLEMMAQGKPKETARDMLPLARKLGWEAPTDAAIRDVVIAGVSAAVAELAPPPSAALFYAAIVGPHKDVYTLRVQGPTTKELERFKPTWEKMLASIRPTKPK